MDFVVSLIVYLFSAAIGIIFAVVAHEAGHLLFGLRTGYSFVSFRLLKWLWVKEVDGRVRVTKSASHTGIVGQCLMEPVSWEGFRYALYNFGGGIVNFVFSVLFFGILVVVQSGFLQAVFFGLWVSSFMITFNNLVPLIAGGIPNDARNVKEAARSLEAKRGFYVILKSNGLMAKGARLMDLPEDMFALDEDADLSNYFVVQTLLLRAAQLEECGKYKESYELLLRPDAKKLPLYYSTQIILALMFIELVSLGDEQSVLSAQKRLQEKSKDKLFQKLLNMNHPAYLPYKAAKTAFLDKEPEKAKELIEKARTQNPTQKNPGYEYSVEQMLIKIESRL